MFDEFRIHMFSLKKNVLCKKLFDVPLVDYGVDGIGEIFQPSELSQLSRISNFKKRAGRFIEIGDLRELGELGELEEPCPQSVLLPFIRKNLTSSHCQ